MRRKNSTSSRINLVLKVNTEHCNNCVIPHRTLRINFLQALNKPTPSSNSANWGHPTTSRRLGRDTTRPSLSLSRPKVALCWTRNRHKSKLSRIPTISPLRRSKNVSWRAERKYRNISPISKRKRRSRRCKLDRRRPRRGRKELASPGSTGKGIFPTFGSSYLRFWNPCRNWLR